MPAFNVTPSTNHFPDERSLGLACSGLFVEQYPLPDPTRWLRIADGEQRLRRGLAAELYAYFEANAARLAPILRDSEEDALVRQLLNLRVTPQLTNIRRCARPTGFAARRAAKASPPRRARPLRQPTDVATAVVPPVPRRR